MAKVVKRVTFYDTEVETTDEKGLITVKKVKADFWEKAFLKIDGVKSHKRRIATISRVRYFGGVSRPVSPPLTHLQVGRLRDLSEHLEQTDLLTGAVGPLVLPDPNLRVSEPTFVVPFGAMGRVAMLSPGRLTRHETLARWLTDVLGLAARGKSIRFVPVADPEALERLIASIGAVGIEFNLDADQPLPTGDGSALLDAVDELRSSGPSRGTLTVGWSLGRDGGSIADRNLIKDIAMKIATGGFAHRATANLVVEDEDGNLHRETHDLISDRIVQTVRYEIEADQQTTSAVLLNAIGAAIQQFNKIVH